MRCSYSFNHSYSSKIYCMNMPVSCPRSFVSIRRQHILPRSHNPPAPHRCRVCQAETHYWTCPEQACSTLYRWAGSAHHFQASGYFQLYASYRNFVHGYAVLQPQYWTAILQSPEKAVLVLQRLVLLGSSTTILRAWVGPLGRRGKRMLLDSK